MKSKFYAIKRGRRTGVFRTWEECSKNVSGYPNAVYKSFSNINDAKNYLYDNTGESNRLGVAELSAYIDGSYDNNLKKYSYAVIMFHNGKRMEYSRSESEEELVKLRNVAGELKAAMYVMEYALNNSIKSVDLFYDYIGIEMWATAKWKANHPFTIQYSSFSKKILDTVDIKFIKIKSHSGNKYNEEVDFLAKEAIHIDEKNDLKNIEKCYNKTDGFAKSTEEDIGEIRKTKRSLNLGSYIIGNKLVDSKDIYNKFKTIWKTKKRLLSEVKGLKSYFNVDNLSFVIIVYTENEEIQINIKGEDING